MKIIINIDGRLESYMDKLEVEIHTPDGRNLSLVEKVRIRNALRDVIDKFEDIPL